MSTIPTDFWPSLDDAERVRIVFELSAQGKFADEIADHLNAGIDQIVMIRIRHDIDPAGGRREWCRTPEYKRKCIHTLTLTGYSDSQIALQLGTSPQMVRRHRASYRLASPRRDLDKQPAAQDKLLQLRDRGLSQKSAASELGYSYSAVHRFVRRHRIFWPEARGNQPLKSSREIFADAIRSGETPSSAALIAGVTRKTASIWIKELELEPAPTHHSANINALIRDLAASGTTASYIAARTGITINAVRRRANRMSVILVDGRLKHGQP